MVILFSITYKEPFQIEHMVSILGPPKEARDQTALHLPECKQRQGNWVFTTWETENYEETIDATW